MIVKQQKAYIKQKQTIHVHFTIIICVTIVKSYSVTNDAFILYADPLEWEWDNA